MTEKRFRVQEHCLRSSYGIEAENWLVTNDNHSVVLNDKAEAHMVANMCNDVIDVLNEQHETITRLKKDFDSCSHNWALMYDEAKNKVGELSKENEELKSTIKEVTELLSDEVDLFSDEATEHDINAYMELKLFDNKDAFYMATATKKAIRMLKELQE